ncbi:MAG: serine/threonine protein kinase [Anaerolineae bacterium]|nr:serine/threonine protein kinase [Anaerolineae bacterium]
MEGRVNICAVCGTDNRAGARFCRRCRSLLPPASRLTPACPTCGIALRQGARFCKQCGRPVPAVAQQPGVKCPFCGVPIFGHTYLCPGCKRYLPAVHRQVEMVAFPSIMPSPSESAAGEPVPLTLLAGRYAIIERIARGGMGAVYKAHDRRLGNKIVAVKEMDESAITPIERAEVIEAFQREAALLATLEHPNLVRVTDSFQEGKCHYLVMEYIDGHTLQKMIETRTEPFDEAQVLTWADQLCDVLSYLHSQNPKIIYRDMKPSNVMVVRDTDTVKLIDFGIARFYKPGRERDTIQFGTEGYAPPEQYGSAQTDELADVYALGATLHHLLTLRDPRDKPFYFPPVRMLNPRVSRQVEEAVARAVEVNKGKRFASIAEMRTALMAGRPKRADRRPAVRVAALPKAKQGASPLPSIDFGRVNPGSLAHKMTITIPQASGQDVELRTTAPWLTVHPKTISGGDREASLIVNLSLLKPGKVHLKGCLIHLLLWPARFLVPAEREFHACLEIDNHIAPPRQVPVRVTLSPSKRARILGWLATGGIVMIELAILTVAVLALIYLL